MFVVKSDLAAGPQAQTKECAEGLCIDIGHDPNGDGTYYDNLDIDGNVRVYNDRVDMGADEVACDDIYNPLDWNVDAIVDVDDLIVLANAWLSDPCATNWDDRCDLGSDSFVNLVDFAAFGIEWLWQPCWTSSGSAISMMMGAESALISETAKVDTAGRQQISEVQPPRIELIKELLDWLGEHKDEIDEDLWLSLVTGLEEMLEELEE